MKKKTVIFLVILVMTISIFKISIANSVDENSMNEQAYQDGNELIDANIINDIDDDDEENVAREGDSEISDIINEIKEGKSASEIRGIDEDTYNAIKKAIEENKEIEAVVDARLLKVYDITEELISIVEKEKGDAQELGYFDINLLVKVDNKQIGKITETNRNIKVTIDVEDLVKMLSNIERKYSVIRIHESETADTINANLNEDGTITFETNLFSEYVVIYNNLEEEPEWPEEIGINSKTDNTDLIIMEIALVVLIIIAIISGVLLKKSKSNMKNG